MKFIFEKLPYDYNALEPVIDAMTMEIHYSKHHQTYFDKFTDAISGTSLDGQSLDDIFSGISAHPTAVRNNGGGFYNHNVFWKCMNPGGSEAPVGDFAVAINQSFGSLENLKKEMSAAGVARFGSGFVWLIVDGAGALKVTSTPNQDNPLMNVVEQSGKPILAIDVWEHAYYLKYQNRRPDYLNAFWSVANWDYASQMYTQAKTS